MKKLTAACILYVSLILGSTAFAQQIAWIQIEAQPTLKDAERSVRRFAGNLEQVVGFRMQSGWYAVALGPYSPEAAEVNLINLRGNGRIPGDSFIAESASYQQQFWPVGANGLTAAPQTVPVPDANTATPVIVETPPVPVADETRAEARLSERELDRPGREALQVALQWEGFYNSGIDGAFGPGTRNAMADYQASRGYEATGILTTKQRAEILASYQSVIDSLALRTVLDQDAGIEIVMPSAMVGFSRHEAPFAHYDAKNDSGVRVVLISQTGDQNTLFGLYDILQTLEIVPLDGPRERRNSDFTLSGTDSRITSYTYAKLVDGAVKGFTLIWPKGDDKRRDMALNEMKASFASMGVQALADTAGLDAATQSLDLLSGLDIRRPDVARSGFYVDGQGVVLTTAEAVASCQRITIDDTYDATVLAVNKDLGVALLRPAQALAPTGVAQFLTSAPRLKSDVAVAGYSYEGRLGAPTLTFGTLADLKGLVGETNLSRLALAVTAGDAGGPVLDSGGAVLGILLARADSSDRQLPADVNFAVNAGTLAEFLAESGVTATATDASVSMDPVDMTSMAANMTVLISCWN